MKFNMGCGLRKKPGYINVDASAEAEPDEVWDLEATPWPWPSDCADEVSFIHALEHMGADPRVFVAIMQELYRICRDGARVVIDVPHPRHDDFLADPTHVRPILPETLQLFDRRLNERWRAEGLSNTPLALYASVDFQLAERAVILAEPFAGQFDRGEISGQAAGELVRHQYNVARAFHFVLVARKPLTGG